MTDPVDYTFDADTAVFDATGSDTDILGLGLTFAAETIVFDVTTSDTDVLGLGHYALFADTATFDATAGAFSSGWGVIGDTGEFDETGSDTALAFGPQSAFDPGAFAADGLDADCEVNFALSYGLSIAPGWFSVTPQFGVAQIQKGNPALVFNPAATAVTAVMTVASGLGYTLPRIPLSAVRAQLIAKGIADDGAILTYMIMCRDVIEMGIGVFNAIDCTLTRSHPKTPLIPVLVGARVYVALLPNMFAPIAPFWQQFINGTAYQ